MMVSLHGKFPGVETTHLAVGEEAGEAAESHEAKADERGCGEAYVRCGVSYESGRDILGFGRREHGSEYDGGFAQRIDPM